MIQRVCIVLAAMATCACGGFEEDSFAGLSGKGETTVDWRSFDCAQHYAGFPGLVNKCTHATSIMIHPQKIVAMLEEEHGELTRRKELCDATLPSGASMTLRGKVVDARLRPVTRAAVVVAPNADYVISQVNEQGEYEFKSITPGFYQVEVVYLIKTIFDKPEDKPITWTKEYYRCFVPPAGSTELSMDFEIPHS